MNNPLMLSVITSSGQQVKIFTLAKGQFQNQQLVKFQGQIYVYTKQTVFYNKIQPSSLNRQLNWNMKSYSLIEESLSGKRHNITVNFKQQSGLLNLLCQIQGGIKLMLFQLKLINLKLNALTHMKRLFAQTQQQLEIKQKQVVKQCFILKQQIKNVLSLNSQLEQQYKKEIQHLKTSFLPIINDVKRKIRKNQGPSIEEVPDDSSQTKTRKILKVNRQSLKSNPSVNDELLKLFN